MVKILFIRFSSIGDIVLTTPVIRCVKQQLPAVELHYLTKKAFAPVLENNPYIDRLHFLGEDEAQMRQMLKAEKFDYIIDLHHNLRTWRFRMALGSKTYAFNKLNFEKWLLVNTKIDRMPAKHIVDRYMETVATLGVKNDGAGLDYFLHPTTPTPALPQAFRDGFTAFVIGGQHATKMLPADKITALCAAVKGPICLLGGAEDAAKGEAIALSNPEKIFNAAGKYPLNQSVQLLKAARLVITHDTGLMHIAAAFKQKIITLWGNTIPAFGMYPYLPQAYASFEQTLSCRPCSKIGYAACPKGHFRCMRDQNIAAIAAQANAWLTEK